MTPCFFMLVYQHFFFGFVDSVFLSILFTTDKDNFSVIKWNRKWQWNVGVDWHSEHWTHSPYLFYNKNYG